MKAKHRLGIWLYFFLTLSLDRLHKYFYIISRPEEVAWNSGFLGGELSFTGASFTPHFSALMIGIIFSYLVIAARVISNEKFRLGLSLFAGGVISNFIDRILYSGRVADPIFVPNLVYTNVADVLQLIGLLLMVMYLLVELSSSKHNKRVGLLASYETQIKIFFEAFVVLGISIFTLCAGVYFSYGALKRELVVLVSLLIPLASFLLTLLSNQRIGALRGFERYLSMLSQNPDADLKLRHGDSKAEVERYQALVKKLLDQHLINKNK